MTRTILQLNDPASPLSAAEYRALCERVASFQDTDPSLDDFGALLGTLVDDAAGMLRRWEEGALESDEYDTGLRVYHAEMRETLLSLETQLPSVLLLLIEARRLLESLPETLPPVQPGEGDGGAP